VATPEISAVIPTRDRAGPLARTLSSLAEQSLCPAEVILVDASRDDASRLVASHGAVALARRGCTLRWQRAAAAGAAAQRNQGVALAAGTIIAFFDDDIVFEADCLTRLRQALLSDPRIGGVNAMISNQRYRPPGFVSRSMFRLMAGRSLASYAGRLLGPAVNLLPEDRDDLPEVVPVEWLNTTCTFYRREALPNPPFTAFFTGYSLMEDVALSVRVAKSWKLANARTARIFHDSQPGSYKNDVAALSEMQLVNRHYVMTEILDRRGTGDLARLAVWELFQLSLSAVQQRLGGYFWQMLRGKWRAAGKICRRRATPRSP
jgi:glycosyltransferase involved in cell wall biosynthesis